MLTIDSKIQKWGNGLALRVSGLMRDMPGFEEGSPVRIEVTEDGFTVRRTAPERRFQLPYSEEDILKGLKKNTDDHDLIPTLLPSEWPDQ